MSDTPDDLPTLTARLHTLCDPSAEALRDSDRIDAFVATGRELIEATADRERLLSEALVVAENEIARLRAHIAANCRICRGSGIAMTAYGTGNAELTTWPCYHGLAEGADQ